MNVTSRVIARPTFAMSSANRLTESDFANCWRRTSAPSPTVRRNAPRCSRAPVRAQRARGAGVFADLQRFRQSRSPTLRRSVMARSVPQCHRAQPTPPLVLLQLELRRPALHTWLPPSLLPARAAQTDRRTRTRWSFPRAVPGRETSGNDTVSGSRPTVLHHQQPGIHNATHARQVFPPPLRDNGCPSANPLSLQRESGHVLVRQLQKAFPDLPRKARSPCVRLGIQSCEPDHRAPIPKDRSQSPRPCVARSRSQTRGRQQRNQVRFLPSRGTSFSPP